MGLFDFGKKKKEKHREMAPLSYWEEQSYMIAIPKEMRRELFLSNTAENRMYHIPMLSVKELQPATETSPMLFTILFEGEEYTGGLYAGPVNVSALTLRKDFYFSEEEWNEVIAAKEAYTIFMKFNPEAKKSFHLQLKLVTALVPDLIGLMDESAERIFCPNWVRLAAESGVTPGPCDMFTVQAVSERCGEVWLHTHGLSRCGITELEVVSSDREHCNSHCNVINSFASYLLDKKNEFIPGESSRYIGVLNGNVPVVATCLPWTKGLDEYKNLMLGGENDRKNGHNSLTSLVFLYTSEQDEKEHRLSKVSVYDKLWESNPIFFFSTEETDRMRKLARERFHFVKRAIGSGFTVITKIGLSVDEEKKEAFGEFEHIWFEVTSFDGDRFCGVLTQEPYNVSGIHKDDKRWMTVDEVTDWVIYTKEFPVTPDKAYLMIR